MFKKLFVLIAVCALIPSFCLEKLGAKYQLHLPRYMEQNFKKVPKPRVFKRWLWINDPDPVEFMYISQESSIYDFDEAFIGEKYLSTLSLESFVKAYQQKNFPDIHSLSFSQEYLDPEHTRMLVHWKPYNYSIPIQRVSLVQKGLFGSIYIFSFVANQNKIHEEKVEAWEESLRLTRVYYQFQ